MWRLHISHFVLPVPPSSHGAKVPVPELQAHGGIELRPVRQPLGSEPVLLRHRYSVRGPAPVRSDLEGAGGPQRQGDNAAVPLPPVGSEVFAGPDRAQLKPRSGLPLKELLIIRVPADGHTSPQALLPALGVYASHAPPLSYRFRLQLFGQSWREEETKTTSLFKVTRFGLASKHPKYEKKQKSVCIYRYHVYYICIYIYIYMYTVHAGLLLVDAAAGPPERKPHRETGGPRVSFLGLGLRLRV